MDAAELGYERTGERTDLSIHIRNAVSSDAGAVSALDSALTREHIAASLGAGGLETLLASMGTVATNQRIADDRVNSLTGSGLASVNSSLNAVAIYERLGFELDGDVVEMDGVRFQPMRQRHNGLEPCNDARQDRDCQTR